MSLSFFERGLTMDKEIFDYPSNSKTQKCEEKRPVVKKVIKGSVRQQKKGVGRRFLDTFIEDNTANVGSYIYYDVIIPAIKSMVCDLVGWGGFAEMLLFGEKRGSHTRREGGRSFTSYGAFYKYDDRDRDRNRDKDKDRRYRDISRVGRARHEFDEIILETRGEAERVLSHLVDLVLDYRQATVADLYDLVGIQDEHVDHNWGWTDLRGAEVRRASGGGYVLILPRTQHLN
jgi:hypothetical protein